jgi:putative ABC transport system ATP-binding protein
VAVVALVGGRLAADGRMSIGDLVAAAGLTQFLIGPFSRISMVIAELARSRASAGRIAEVLSAPAAVVSGTASVASPACGAVELRHVATGSLEDVSFTVATGELVGVAALAPSDAHALIACLARDVDPESGTVAIDDVDFALLDLDELRAALVVSHHHSHLFGGRLIDNITAVTPDGTDVAAALAASATDEVASTLPDGVDTEMTERGRSLSGGQRQRVTLARALAADPPVLVLHDPTTAVDAATEATIADGLVRLRAGRTTIVVTTSPGLLAVTDRVVVIEDGRTVDEGTHATLLARAGRYRSVVVA